MTFYTLPQHTWVRRTADEDPIDTPHSISGYFRAWQWSSSFFNDSGTKWYSGPRASFKSTTGTTPGDMSFGVNAWLHFDDPIVDPDQSSVGKTNTVIGTRGYFNSSGLVHDGQKVDPAPASSYPPGFGWWSWAHCDVTDSGVERHIFCVQGADENSVPTGTYHVFYTTNYGQSHFSTVIIRCLTTRSSGWSSNLRSAGIWRVSDTAVYLFMVDASNGELYFVKRNDVSDTFGSPTLVSSGNNTITKLHIQPVGAGTTELYLITDDGVFIWDWSTETAVASSFSVTFPTHAAKMPPITIGSTYYHFQWVQETKTLYKWTYTSGTYTNPTRTSFAVPSDPGYSNETFLGFSIEFNTSTNELYAVAFWRDRTGVYPTGQHNWRMKYVEATSGTSWSSATMVEHRPVLSDGTNPFESGPQDTHDLDPYTPFGRSAPDHVSVVSAYSLGSNNAYRRTVLSAILETPGYSTTPTDSFSKGLGHDGVFLNFWTDGVGFYANAATTISSTVSLSLAGATDAVGEVSINAGATLTLNESYLSTLTYSVDYDIEGATNFQNGEIVLNAPATLSIDGSLASDYWVSGAVAIDGSATLTLDGSVAGETLEISFHVPYVVIGTTYHEEFLTYVNAKRDEYGLPHYKLPTAAMYAAHTDVAQLHAENMASTRTFAHTGPNLPAAWDTYEERFAVSGFEGMAENIKMDWPDQYLNYPIFDDTTILSPQEAYDAWWNSTGHRANLLFDWGSDDIYSYLGIGIGQSPSAYGDDRVFYLCHVMGRYGPEGTVVAKEGALHVTYDSTGALIESINVTFDLETYANVRKGNTAVYGIRVGKDHSAVSGAMVAAAHEAPIFYGTAKAHVGTYSGTIQVQQDNESPYRFDVLATVARDNEGVYGIKVSRVSVAKYSQPPRAKKTLLARYADVPAAKTGFEASYSVPLIAKKDHSSRYASLPTVKRGNTASYSSLPVVLKGHTAPYASVPAATKTHIASYDPLAVATRTHVVMYDQPPMVAKEHASLYGEFAQSSKAHVSMYSQPPMARREHSTVYEQPAMVVKSHVSLYSQPPMAIKAHVSVYEQPAVAAKAHVAVYAQPAVAKRGHMTVYAQPAVAHRAHMIVYEQFKPVKKGFTVPWSLQSVASKDHEAVYYSVTNVRTGHEGDYGILSVDPVKKSLRSFYSLLSDQSAIQVIPETTLTVTQSVESGSPLIEGLAIEDAVLECSEGSSYWSAKIRILSKEAFILINEGDLIELSVGGETYSMVVLGKSISRATPVSLDMRISAASKVVLLDAPRATPIGFTYDTAMTAKEIVEDMLGEVVTWDLVNWSIPANRVQFEDVAPLEAARRIVAAAGGLIVSNKDGSLTIRSEFPVATHRMADGSPDQTITDDDDNLSVVEGYEYKEQYNLFRISEAEVTQGDRFDWIPDEVFDTRGILRLYPSPWRETLVVRTTSDNPSVTYSLTGVVSRTEGVEEEELVEFKNGVGSTRYPVAANLTVEWLSQSLGSVISVPYSTSLTTSNVVNGGYGLARVTYRVDSIEYSVQGVLGTSVQFIAEE